MEDEGQPLKLSLSTPTGAIDVQLGAVVVTEQCITADFEMSCGDHDQALADGWFHLGSLSKGVGARPFGPGGAVRLHARLDPQYVPGLNLVVPTAAGVTELLEKLDATSPLRCEDAWYAREATREVPADEPNLPQAVADAAADGSLREGYRTAWGADGAAGLPITALLAEQLEDRFEGVEALEADAGFRWQLSGQDSSWTTTAIVDEVAQWCVLHSTITGPSTRLDRAALIERASILNRALLFGSWYVHTKSNTAAFRSGADLAGAAATPSLIEQVVTRHLDIVDEYASTFL